MKLPGSGGYSRGPALGVSPIGQLNQLFSRHASELSSYQILTNSLAFNEASCVHQMSYVSLDTAKTVQGGISVCETDPTPAYPYTWLAAQEKGVSSFPNHSLLVSMMDKMLARTCNRIQGPSMPQCQTVTDTASSNIYLTAPTPEQPDPRRLSTTYTEVHAIRLHHRNEQRWSSNLRPSFLHSSPSNTSFLPPLSSITMTLRTKTLS